MICWIRCWIIIFVGFFTISAYAVDEQNQLAHILTQMRNIKINLQKKYDKKNELQSELKKIDLIFDQTTRENEELQKKIFKQRVSIAELTNQAAIHSDQLNQLQENLASQLQMAYLLKSETPLKIILSQQNLNQTNRYIKYYASINQLTTQTIQQLQNNLLNLNNRKHHLMLQSQNLQALLSQQRATEDKLISMRTERTELVNEINQNIQSQNQKLKKLMADKERLENTLNQLKPIVWPMDNNNFATLKGHLPWPTQGKVLHYFDTPIEKSEINWTGELIAAPENQPIYAVANGVVVFAKWLEGYGLLLILNHGNGYMTLYGRAHVIYKHEGDHVKSGDVIGTVGESGGFGEPSLYFGIRYNAQPLNPSQWCAG